MVKSPSRQSGDPAAHQPDTDAVSGLPAAAMAGTAPESFELALGELEQIVQRMEGGALSLEQSLADLVGVAPHDHGGDELGHALAVEVHAAVGEEAVEKSDRIRAAANARHDGVGQAALAL